MAVRKRARRRRPWWIDLPSEELLDVRLCDLGLTIEGTSLGRRVQRLYDELERAGLRFRPYVWLSNDWATPDGATGFAIPFYLAHPRLVRLEHSQMFEAEGSTHVQCMKLLRHEAAHAIDNAYLLHKRSDWRRTFGAYSSPYRGDYQANPTSRNYVQNLGAWYAQSHPAEDYAETFSVWLMPKSAWRAAYAGWPALKKLEAVDRMMAAIGRKRPRVRSRTREDSLPRLRMTLREHYREKKAGYDVEQPARHDRQLRLVFAPSGTENGHGREHAAKFLRSLQHELRTKVSALTEGHRYVVDEALNSLIRRCRELNLRLCRPKQQARLGAAVLLTMVTMSLSNRGRPRFSR